MNKLSTSQWALSLMLLAFSIITVYLQSKKCLWVDECYTYYGILHDSFLPFYDSITSGINFSPPLYFFINWVVQLLIPNSIDLLRYQSLFWTIAGIIFIFIVCSRAFSSRSASLGSLLLLAQSNLLLEQSLEARHYTMFLASSAWVMYQLQCSQNSKGTTYQNTILSFLAHVSLCLVHYLGIIFSGLLAISLIFTNSDKAFHQRVPSSIYLSWVLVIPTYLFLLNQQSSHLGNWPRPNGLENLLSTINESFFFISIIIPICIALCLKNVNLSDFFSKKKKITFSNQAVLLTSLLWFLTPVCFWCLSHTTNINLFKDRYFIPKEVGAVILITFILDIITRNVSKSINKKSTKIPILVTLCFAISILLVRSKRLSFAMEPERNYHNFFLVNEKINHSKIPIIHTGDPSLLVNLYRNKNNHFLLILSNETHSTYKTFSKEIPIISESNFQSLKEFIFIGDQDLVANFINYPYQILSENYINPFSKLKALHVSR